MSDKPTFTAAELKALAEQLREPDDEPRCSNPDGHKWAYTGTAYGGDDERWLGEGRCYCVYCGADGDG